MSLFAHKEGIQKKSDVQLNLYIYKSPGLFLFVTVSRQNEICYRYLLYLYRTVWVMRSTFAKNFLRFSSHFPEKWKIRNFWNFEGFYDFELLSFLGEIAAVVKMKKIAISSRVLPDVQLVISNSNISLFC